MPETLEKNKKIAEWLGYKTEILTVENCSPSVCIMIGITHNNPVLVIIKDIAQVPFKPDKDWNQLMEVVEKIEGSGCVGDPLFRFHITGLCCELYKYYVDMDKPKYIICTHIRKSKIQAVYDAVYEYISEL